MTGWQIDFESLPGPDREKLVYFHDVVRPAATKDLAAVVYSVEEVRMGFYLGYCALFQGPPAAPSILWRPEAAICGGDLSALQWLDKDRFVVANLHVGDWNNCSQMRLLFIDVEEKTLALYPTMNSFNAYIEPCESEWFIREYSRNERLPSHDGEPIDPAELDWRPWEEIDDLKMAYRAGHQKIPWWQFWK